MRGVIGAGGRKSSFAMVRVLAQHRPRAVQGFGQQRAHQGVGQGEAGEADGFVRAGLERRRQAVWSAHDQRHVPAFALPGFEFLRQRQRAQIRAALIKDDAVAARWTSWNTRSR